MKTALQIVDQIRSLKLDVDEINAYNHLAVFLGFMIEQELVDPDLLSTLQDKYGDLRFVDLRNVIKDDLGSDLNADMFTDEGAEFFNYYVAEGSSGPNLYEDLNLFALECFGDYEKAYHKYHGMPYLFIPYDEFIETANQYLESRFESFNGLEVIEDPHHEELAAVFMEYISPESKFIPSVNDDDSIAAQFAYQNLKGKIEGFYPVLVAVEEELLERLIVQSSPSTAIDDVFHFNLEEVEDSRRRFIDEAQDMISSIDDIFGSLQDQREAELNEEGLTLNEIRGNFDIAMDGGDPLDLINSTEFDSYWTGENDTTAPLVLSNLKLEHPAHILAHIPFGPYNDCPEPSMSVAIAHYFYEKYGARVAVITSDCIEFTLDEPLEEDVAMKAAEELFLFCPRALEQTQASNATIADLAEYLTRAQVWTCPFGLASDDEYDPYADDADFDEY